MEEIVSAADANRKFSAILREVREGRSFVVTSHGRPVARIVPASEDERVSAAAREAFFTWLEQRPTTTEPWTRDELYEDEE